MSYEIPVIDIAPFLDPDATQQQKDAVVSVVRHACQKYGFFQLEGHGVPVELQEKMIDCSRLFFNLPLEEKKKLSMKNAMGQSNRGYEVIGGQKLQSDAFPDLKEGLYIGEEIHPGDDRAGKFLQGPNLWPETLPEDAFRAPITEYRDRMVALAHSLLTILALGLPYGPDIFEDFQLQPVANVRLLHYPPQMSTDEKQLGGTVT